MKLKKVIASFMALFLTVSAIPVSALAAGQSGAEAAESVQNQNEEMLSTTSMAGALRSVAGEARQTYRQTGEIVLVLDPGHDNTHGGASGNGLHEEDLNLKIARYCRQKLEQYDGVTIYMTREEEGCPYPGTTSTDDNANRVYNAAAVGADFYISFHLNSSTRSSASGATVYYPNSNYNPVAGTLGQKLAQAILDALTRLGLRDMGTQIRNSEDHTTYPDGSLADYYGVIRRSKECGFPGIIIEHAFISNGSDASRYLRSEAGLKQLGEADADAIIAYFGLRERDSIGVFDAEYYYNRYPDLREKIGWNESALWQHFKNYGIYEGRVASPVFDVAYYREHNEDLSRAFGNDLWKYAEHFVDYGMQEQRRGAEEFDVHSYYLQYADLRQAYRDDWESYYRHYIDYGRAEGRQGTGCGSLQNPVTSYDGVDYSGVYDFAYYTSAYSDIRQEFGDDDIGALEHFVHFGMQEGRLGNTGFDVHSYRRQYADLRRAFENDLEAYYLHYIDYGQKEGRQGSGCDRLQNPATVYGGKDYADVYDFAYYTDAYPDIRKAFGEDDAAALEHFVTFGMAEGRSGNAKFDVNSYRMRYGDLRSAFGDDLAAYYQHYMSYGKSEGRQGSGCSSLQGAATVYDGVDYAPVYDYQYYVDHNPDVKAAYGLNDGAVLEHFVRYGMAEGRTAKESFRAQAYRDRYGDLQQAFGNDWRAYYLHYLEHGLAEGRQGA